MGKAVGGAKGGWNGTIGGSIGVWYAQTAEVLLVTPLKYHDIHRRRAGPIGAFAYSIAAGRC